MTNYKETDLFDYAVEGSPEKQSDEGSSSDAKSTKGNDPNIESSEIKTVEGEIEPSCPCLPEGKEEWGETLRELDIPIVPCGHALDYLGNVAGATITVGTAEDYAYQQRRFVEYLHCQNLTVCDTELRDILQYFNYRAKELLSKSHLSAIRAVITNLYKHITLYRDAQPEVDWALIREEIDPNDYKTAESVKREPLTKDQLNKLLDEMDCFRNRLMTRIGVELGPRNIDLCSIEINQIHLDEQEAELSNTKGGGTYTLPITDELALLLRRWIDTERPAWPNSEINDYLFPSREGGHISPVTFTEIVAEAAERAGIQETLKRIPLSDRQKEAMNTEKDYKSLDAVTPHTLRHTFSKLLSEAGLSLEDRSKALDHSDTDVTQEYYSSEERSHVELMKDMFSGVDRSPE